MKLKAGSLILHKGGGLYLVVRDCVTGEPTEIINLTHCFHTGEDPSWLSNIEEDKNPNLTVLNDNMVDIIKRITNE